MFRKLLGFGLLVLLLTSLFGGLSGRRSQAAYYEGYEAGLQAQSDANAGAEAGEGSETAAPPPAAPYHDGFGHGRSFGWGAWGVLGIFAIFFKIGFFFLLLMLIFRLLGPRRWRHRAHWHRGGHHKHGRGWHGEHPGREKSPKWMDDSDDDEPIMTV